MGGGRGAGVGRRCCHAPHRAPHTRARRAPVTAVAFAGSSASPCLVTGAGHTLLVWSVAAGVKAAKAMAPKERKIL